MWVSKIARYLAYCVDGGLLPNFNIKTMVQIMDCDQVWISDQGRELFCELYFLLHLITLDTYDDISDIERITEKLKLFEHQGTHYNEKVMASLIESGMIKRLLD